MDWIGFPGLGLKFENISRSIRVFGIDIYWYGILISIGFLLGIILALRVCRKLGFAQDDIITYILVATPSAIVGARLYYVIFKWSDYKDNLLEIFNTRNGGLAIYGGIIGAVIAVAIMAKIKKQNFLRLMDLAMPYIALGQAIGRWGNFINQEAYGKETTLPWRMTGSWISGEVHPSFFYESVLCLTIFGFLLFYRKKLRKHHGEVLFWYMILYGAVRSFIEYIRGNDALVIGNTDVRVSLVLSLILVVAGILALVFIKKIPGTYIDKELLAVEIREAYIKDTGKDPDTGLPVKTDSDEKDTIDESNDEGAGDDELTVFGSDFDDSIENDEEVNESNTENEDFEHEDADTKDE